MASGIREPRRAAAAAIIQDGGDFDMEKEKKKAMANVAKELGIPATGKKPRKRP